MIYPNFIKENSTIGITAPSNGITKESDLKRLDNALKKLNSIGLKIKETKDVRKSNLGRSSSAYTRAKELEELFQDKNINAIICASGGEFMNEILPFLDYELIKNNPKWFQGYSDPTYLTYIITTNLDIATIYGNNIKVFGMENWHNSLKENIEVLKGNLLIQKSYDKYEKEKPVKITGLESFNLKSKVYWKNLKNENQIEIKGRIIGGCIDVLNELYGTRFDKTKEFIEKYKKDGIIWYFENCSLTSEELTRVIWKFNDSGYFTHTKGIIFGRSLTNESCYGLTFEETIKKAFENMNIPIIIGADIGHLPPRITIINGAVAKVKSKDGKGEIKFYLE